jgi:HlyD family secretion protein
MSDHAFTADSSSMDIPRPDQARKRRRRRLIWIACTAVAVALITFGLSRLKAAAPTVQKVEVVIETVKRGPMTRQVHGPGTLIPEEIRWIPAQNAGRIERINVLPGAAVKADTIMVELSDPVLEQTAVDALFAVKAAEAELANLHVQLNNQRLTLQASAASAQANYNAAQLDAEVNGELAKSGLVPGIVLKQSQAKAEELRKLNEIEQERLKMVPESSQAQLASAGARLEQLRAMSELKRKQVDALKVRSGIDGVLQKLGDTLQLQEGQQVPAGAMIAKVGTTTRLKAEIKIPEAQARDLELGQPASIDTRNGLIPGHVVRIDPASQNGSVAVDVGLDAALPKGARPELSVEGTIDLERLTDVLYVGRPVNAQSGSTVGVFKLVSSGNEAVRVPVKFGNDSVRYIVVRDGLKEGDQIISSDMSTWDAHERVRLN